ncbi:IS630 family transposase [Deinococcus rubellus]
MEDVLDAYARSYDPDYPVVCLDEARKELLSDVIDPVPGQSGQVKREDYQYIRGGTVSLYLAVEPLAGKRWIRCTERQTRVELAGILRELAEIHYPDVKRIVLVTDNLKPHHFSALYEAFEPELAHTLAQRFEWHYTPEHGSWLDIAEIELSVLARQCLNRRFRDREHLEAEVAAWEISRNKTAVKVNWQFSTKDARVKLRRLYPKWVSSG